LPARACHTDRRSPSLASWRAHGRLADLRAPDLTLQHREASALLAAAGVHLSDPQVTRLVERTEGWPAALLLRDRAHPDDFIDRFTGTSRHVADFLGQDVLARQPEPVSEFLIHTCVLDELTVSLCDALTGRSTADAMLRELECSNLFVVPLDDERRSYRYYHLFGPYLRAELARREPDAVPELHRRAWHWYRERGLVDRAITHAQAAGDIDVAPSSSQQAGPPSPSQGRSKPSAAGSPVSRTRRSSNTRPLRSPPPA